MGKILPPYIGAAYYPEDWPNDEVEPDLAAMKDCGINVVRLENLPGVCWNRKRELTRSDGCTILSAGSEMRVRPIYTGCGVPIGADRN